jgi:LPS export ABC transporter permease LptG
VRIIDKYLLKEFALPLLYCFDAFLMLFLVLDLLENLGDFIQYHVRAGQILQYYLITLPDALVLLLPMSLLLAVLFCLSNLGKHNELIALRASGVGIGRIALPLLACGALATVVVFALNQSLVPRAKERADSFLSEMRGRGAKSVFANFFFANIPERRDWYARRFDTRARQLETVEVHQRNPTGAPLFDIFAETAVWTNNAWRFLQADVYDHARGQEVVFHVAETNLTAINESPRRLAVEGRQADQLTTSELRRHIDVLLHQTSRARRVAEYQVTYHYRFAFPLTCLIIIWLGVPLGTRVSRRGPMLGVGVALLLIVAFYFLTNISLAMGKGERLPPALAAWLTNGVFTVVGAVLMARTR